MTPYAYRCELKAPENWTSIDFGNPKVEPAVHIMVQNIKQQVRSFAPCEGVSCTIQQVPSFDKFVVECFLLEPDGLDSAAPAMLYCHGGGFFLPVQPMMMELAARYAKELKIRVLLPEYRILPRYASPYPFKDCLSVWQWMQTHATELKINCEKLLLYGESAGGALAAGISLWQRDSVGKAAVGQMLIYPVLDNRCSRYPSMRKYSEAAWPLKNNLSMWQRYLQNEDLKAVEYFVPMRATSVANIPSAFIEAQQYDILHDEAVAYAQRLQEARVSVQLREIDGSYHGFDADTQNEFVQSVVQDRIRWMGELLQNKRKGI